MSLESGSFWFDSNKTALKCINQASGAAYILKMDQSTDNFRISHFNEESEAFLHHVCPCDVLGCSAYQIAIMLSSYFYPIEIYGPYYIDRFTAMVSGRIKAALERVSLPPIHAIFEAEADYKQYWLYCSQWFYVNDKETNSVVSIDNFIPINEQIFAKCARDRKLVMSKLQKMVSTHICCL